MPDEEKTQDQIEEEAFNEASAELSGKKEAKDEPKIETEDVEEEEEDKKTGQDVSSEAKKEEKPDWEKEKADFQSRLEKAEKERDANKRFADDQARQRAELEKKQKEEKDKKETEDLEKVPEDVQAYEEEYPEAKSTVEFRSKQIVKKAIGELMGSLTEACGGKDPIEFIKEARETNNQVVFERTVMIGYYDDSGKYVPGHPDIVTINMSKEFHEYVEDKLKNDKELAQRLNDPIYTIKFVSEYKNAQIEKAAEKDKKKAKDQKEEIDEQISGADKDVTKKGPKKQPDPYDEEAAYNEGVKAVEQL